MNSIITQMDSSKSMRFRKKSCVVSLRKGSGNVEDDDPMDDFLLVMDLVTLGAVLMGDEDAIDEGR